MEARGKILIGFDLAGMLLSLYFIFFWLDLDKVIHLSEGLLPLLPIVLFAFFVLSIFMRKESFRASLSLTVLAYIILFWMIIGTIDFLFLDKSPLGGGSGWS